MKRETLLAVNTDLSGRGQAANTDYPENHSKKFNLHSQGQIQAYNLAMAGVQALKMSFETTVKSCFPIPLGNGLHLNIKALKGKTKKTKNPQKIQTSSA